MTHVEALGHSRCCQYRRQRCAAARTGLCRRLIDPLFHLPSAIGIVAVFVPGSLYLLNSKQEHIQHNDHDGQKRIHTDLTHVEKSKKAGTGGKLHGIDDVVTTKAEDVDHDLPPDALNHPVNREKVRDTLKRGDKLDLCLPNAC